MNKQNIKKLVFLGLIISISLILSYLEVLLPPFIPIPFFKIGLAQIGVLITWILFSYKDAVLVSLSKTILASLLLGTFFTYVFFISLGGALVSLIFLFLGTKLKFSIYGISILSALGHNLGQSLIIGLTLSWSLVLVYSPFILLSSLFFGFFIGYIVNLLKKPLSKLIK